MCLQKKEQILAMFKPLQKSIGVCMQCTNTKIIRCVHSLLSRLTTHFPTEACSSNVASKYEELENLYATVSKVIYEGLTNYEKSVQARGASSLLTRFFSSHLVFFSQFVMLCVFFITYAENLLIVLSCSH